MSTSTPASMPEPRAGRPDDLFVAAFRSSPGFLSVIRFRDARVIDVNDDLERLTGWRREDVVGRRAEDLELWSDEPGRTALFREIASRRPGDSRQVTVRTRGGEPRIAEVSWRPVEVGGEEFVILAGRDVTEKVALQGELREAEARYRSLVEQLPAIVYIAPIVEAGAWLYVSPPVESILGYTQEEWLAEPELWEKRVHPDDLSAVDALELDSRDTGAPFVAQYRMLAKDGRVVWLHDQAVVVHDEEGRALFLQGFMLDITQQKRAEDELSRSVQLLREADEERRRLLGRLVIAQDEERERIALDIHDDSLQVMTAVGLRVESLRDRLTDPRHVEAFARLDDIVRRSIGKLRELIFDLHPAILDEYGFVAALRQRLDLMRREDAIQTRLDSGLSEEPPVETRIVLYRIAVEALRNTVKHARARRVDVTVEEADGGIRCRIVDDGSGFLPQEALRHVPGHIGMASMRQRAELAGGWWRVDSSPGAGTAVEFWVPRSPTDELETAPSAAPSPGRRL